MYSKKCQLIDFQKITREGRKPHCTPQWGGGMLFRFTHESLANGVKSVQNGVFAYIYIYTHLFTYQRAILLNLFIFNALFILFSLTCWFTAYNLNMPQKRLQKTVKNAKKRCKMCFLRYFFDVNQNFFSLLSYSFSTH